MFCFRADAGLREIEQHAPAALEAVRRALDEAPTTSARCALGEASLAAPKISFDHAVMERTTRAAVLAADFAWSDIGDWKAVWEHSPRDADGVAREGKVHARDVTDSYLRSDGRLLCVLGVDGPRRRRHRRRGAGRADRARAGGQGPGRRARGRGRRRGAARRRGSTGPGAGTRRWTSATASG